MVCANCDPDLLTPGNLIKVNKFGPDMVCIECGDKIMNKNDHFKSKLKRWDTYYHSICVAVASKSPCLSHQIGAILVREKVVIATGFNGPARGFPHCKNECPRKVAEFPSGEGLFMCPATHAEANCIASAARIGASVSGSTLYMNYILPCKDCMNLLVNAGITEVVIDDLTPYHEMSVDIAAHAGIKVRRFVI